jgi:Flp pilus assembly protein CpaB
MQMRSRGLVVVLAIILATLATVGVFLYSRGVKQEAREGADLVTVVVSNVDIPANSDLDQFIADGQFTTMEVPGDSVVQDAVTKISQLEGERNNAFIFAGEQIPLGRVAGGEVPGGILSIPEGEQAMTVALAAPRAISGSLSGGDNVTVYATFSGLELVRFNKKLEPQSTGTGSTPRFDTTVVLIPEAQVLRVLSETTQDFAGEATTDQSSSAVLQVVLALTPEEAQRFVFAMEEGLVYLSLLPPDQDGVQLDPLTAAQVLFPPAAKASANGQG